MIEKLILTYDELNKIVNEKAELLSIEKNRKVYGLLMNTDLTDGVSGEWVKAYFYAPSLYQRMTIMDSLDKDRLPKGLQLLELNLLKEYSDMKYFNKTDTKNEEIIIGASLNVISKCIKFSYNQLSEIKKNGE